MKAQISRLKRGSFLTTIALVFAVVLGLSACDGMIGLDAENDGQARLRVRMIDAPFPFHLVESADVTISQVDVVGDAFGVVTISEESRSFNLLELQNGVSALLGEVTVDPGTYSQVRLQVETAGIVLKDGTEFAMKVPSERIKVLLDNFTVNEGEEVTLTVDFDVSKSFVVQGNPDTPAGIKGFIFKPTVVPAGVDHKHDDDEDQEGEDGDDDDHEGDDEKGIFEVEGVIDVVTSDYVEIDGMQYWFSDETDFDGADVVELEAGMEVEIEYTEAEDGSFVITKIEADDGDDETDDEDDENEDHDEDEDDVQEDEDEG